MGPMMFNFNKRDKYGLQKALKGPIYIKYEDDTDIMNIRAAVSRFNYRHKVYLACHIQRPKEKKLLKVELMVK